MLEKSTKSTEGRFVITFGVVAIIACGYLISGMVTDPVAAFEMASATDVSELYKALHILKETKVVDLGVIVTILTFLSSVYKNLAKSRTELKGIAITEEAKVRKEAIKNAVPLSDLKMGKEPQVQSDFPKAF
jgi:hypothetical protein